MDRFKCDGHLRAVVAEDLVNGNVLRTIEADGGQSAFSDHVILDVFWRDGHRNRVYHRDLEKIVEKRQIVKLARPYAYVSGADTACPSVLTGVEQYEVEAERLLDSSRFRIVVQSTGLPATMVT